MLVGFDNVKENFGKKGEVLRKLNNLLCNEKKVFVPSTIVLSLDFFNNNIKRKLLNNENKLLTSCQEHQILSEIKACFGNKKLVIRSSASCEDSILFTNSGQYDSFLNLVTEEDILMAINKTLYSFISTNAMSYYKINNIDFKNQGMAVLIQEVAPVIKAGVMFTANPITGKDKPIIEYCDGIGEDVVSGQKAVITIKDNYDNISRVLKELLNTGKKIELAMGKPQDIEWGIDVNNNIFIFQSRPIVFHKRIIDKFQKIALPNKYIKGDIISNGFAIGYIKEIDNSNNTSIILQSGKLTSKDLTIIMNSKAIILQTGGFLSHFANIIREFNKPSVKIKKGQLYSNSVYVVDGYNGYLYKLSDLNFEERKKAYWNYFIDLINNANRNYLNQIGIKNYKFKLSNQVINNNVVNYKVENNKLYLNINEEILEIEFSSLNLLYEFTDNILKGSG